MIKHIFARTKKAIVYTIVFSVLVTSVFSSFLQINFNTVALETQTNAISEEAATILSSVYAEKKYNNYDVWSGKIATSYAGGTGTESDPFIIENVEQLAKMVKDGGKDASKKAAYFKVADGIDALCINDVIDKNLEETVKYLTEDASAKEWFYNSTGFTGVFNGNGVTIFGIYNSSESKKGGLFGTLQSNAFIYNVTFRNNVIIATDENTNTGVLAAEANGKQIIIKNVSVIDSYVRGRWTAAFIGTTTSSYIEFTNCFAGNIDIDYNGKGVTNGGGSGGIGGFTGDCVWGSGYVTMTDCLTVGIYPVCYNIYNSQSSGIIYKDVYTDFDLTAQEDYGALSQSAKDKFSEIKKLSIADSTGLTNPKSNMNFDWDREWTLTKGYPIPAKHTVNNGTPGAVWSGGIADVIVGTGTKDNPFVIDTPERLARMLIAHKTGTYYRITEDIRLNDVTDSEWYKKDGLNVWNLDTPSFKANISGFNNKTKKNATIYGLYNPSIKAEENAGLFATMGSKSSVQNIIISNSYFKGETLTEDDKDNSIGAIVGAIDENSKNVVISGCVVEKSVIIENGTNAGGLIGSVSGSGIVYDCASKLTIIGNNTYKGGIVASVSGSLNILTSYCVGNYVSGMGGRVIHVYSDVDQKLSPNASDLKVELLNKQQMTGQNAKLNFVGFDFEKVWAISDEYPIIIGEPLPFDGIPNEVWLGIAANNYAGGSGTETDPYLIATGEQLYKMVTTSSADTIGRHYKLINDIKLNDVNSENWENKTIINSWYVPKGTSNPFRGHFDGDYHIVSGIYNGELESNNYGLFPVIGEGAIIENVGVTNSYIEISTTSSETYAACIVGYVQGFNQSRADFEAAGKKVPIVRNCFADHTTHIEARYAGGIVCGVPSFVDVDNCFFTGFVEAGDDNSKGAILGNSWGKGSKVIKCYSAPLNITNFCGNIVTINAKDDERIYIRDCYALTFRKILNVTILPFEKDKYGGYGVVDYATGLDWEKTWSTVKDGTPVLKGFNKNGHTLDEFSYKDGYKSTITFITNAEDVVVPPITAEMLSPLVLPTPTRYGYTFGGWYAYPELDALFDRDYMIYRDITLYAKWILNGVHQTFENYPNTEYDLGDDYEFYRPGIKNYNVDMVHAGAKCMHRIGNTTDESDFLLNYEDTLKLGSEYVMTYWMLCETPNASVKISLIHNTWPDIEEPISKTEVILNETGVKQGEWKQYSYKFVATTPWVSLRTNGNTSLFFDEIMIAPTGLFFKITNSEDAKEKDNKTENSDDNKDNGDLNIDTPVVEDSDTDDFNTDDSNIDNSIVEDSNDDELKDDSKENTQKEESKNTSQETNKKESFSYLYLWIAAILLVILLLVSGIFLYRYIVKKHKK